MSSGSQVAFNRVQVPRRVARLGARSDRSSTGGETIRVAVPTTGTPRGPPIRYRDATSLAAADGGRIRELDTSRHRTRSPFRESDDHLPQTEWPGRARSV